jgi:hypothetical protein
MATTLPQVVEQQRRQDGFAHPGVGSRNENDAWQINSAHGTELTTIQPS